MAAAIRIVIPGAVPVRDTSRKCPLGDQRITLHRSQAICRAHALRLPQAIWAALDAAWDDGRGAESADYLTALEAAERVLAEKGELR